MGFISTKMAPESAQVLTAAVLPTSTLGGGSDSRRIHGYPRLYPPYTALTQKTTSRLLEVSKMADDQDSIVQLDEVQVKTNFGELLDPREP